MKRHLAAIGAITAISAAGLTGVQIASAATNSSSNDHMSNLVDALATKFNLNKSDVQSVFDEQRSQMEADREADLKKQVAQLVSDGKLTQDQADKINAKRAELKAERDANRTADQNLSDDQRQAKMEERKTALDTWFEQNGIDSQYHYLLMGGRGHGGPGGMHGMKDQAASTSDSSNSSQ